MPASEAVDLDEAAARMAASVRDAGALALSMFGRPIQHLDEIRIVAGQRRRYCRRPTAARAARPTKFLRRLAVRGKRRRPVPPRRALPLDCRSDRRHARLSRRLAGLERLGGARRQWPAGGRLPLRARERSVFHGHRAVRALPATARRSRRPRAPRSNNCALPARASSSSA